ncbi:MAG TPA: hypothetical protein VMT35_19810 [Ignavibacteriaceae bacterium]|nr:hypothetical protein [Ignavibacteriaceae bacterium]
MNTGQMLITIGAMTLLSSVLLRVNNNFLSNGEILLSSKSELLAVSLATSIIEEANKRAFDEKTIGNSATNLSDLTPSSDLKFDAGETISTFDDFDDYNGFLKTVSDLPSAEFKVSCKVTYIKVQGNQLVETYDRAWNKRLVVTVSSPSMTDTIKMSTVFSYWFFR